MLKNRNHKMYQFSARMAEVVDYILASLKKAMNQLETVYWQGSKAVSPGKVTKWVNKHHADSSKRINDEIKELEASLAKGTGDDSTYRHLKDYESNTYFTRSVEYNAGKEGKGFSYKVYQRGDIDWNMVRTKGVD